MTVINVIVAFCINWAPSAYYKLIGDDNCSIEEQFVVPGPTSTSLPGASICKSVVSTDRFYLEYLLPCS